MRDHGWRLTTGYDLEDRCLIELPDTIVASINAAGTRPVDLPGSNSGARELAELRAEIPTQHHALFDELVADARESYGLRDENGPLTYEWPAGLLRRAVLECGRRLAATACLRDPLDVFELDVPEIADLLTGDGGPGLETISARAEERQRWSELRPPRRLGPDPLELPPSVLPPHLERITRIVTLIMGHLEAAPTHSALEGTGIGTTTATGRARVVADADEALAAMEPGDILVVRYTTPTYNTVLTMAGGLVTAEGGAMSHAAVIARELGLPAVIGAAAAMERITDGATITIDPIHGTVIEVAAQ